MERTMSYARGQTQKMKFFESFFLEIPHTKKAFQDQNLSGRTTPIEFTSEKSRPKIS